MVLIIKAKLDIIMINETNWDKYGMKLPEYTVYNYTRKYFNRNQGLTGKTN